MVSPETKNRIIAIAFSRKITYGVVLEEQFKKVENLGDKKSSKG